MSVPVAVGCLEHFRYLVRVWVLISFRGLESRFCPKTNASSRTLPLGEGLATVQ